MYMQKKLYPSLSHLPSLFSSSISLSTLSLTASLPPSLSLSPPHLLSLSHTHTVKSEIVTPVPHHTRVQSGHDVNLNCTARGTNLTFQWSYRGKTYNSTSDCRNGICVTTEISSSDPLTETSHLSIHGFETTVVGDTSVTCRVTPRVDNQFHSIPLTSIGMLTVYDEVLTPSK